MTLAVRIRGVGWRSIALTSAGTNTFPLVGSFWDYSDNDLIDNNEYVTLKKNKKTDDNRQTDKTDFFTPCACIRGNKHPAVDSWVGN